MKSESLHKGHRERLRQKFLKNPESLLDHEVLELILFSVFKRGDTNPLAHTLIQTFGSLKGVLFADENALKSVKGVGDSCVLAIKLYANLLKRIEREEEKKEVFKYSTYKHVLIEEFKKFDEEVFILFLLDKKFNIIYKAYFNSNQSNKVKFDIKDVAKIVTQNPAPYAIICHNHRSGILKPTEADDITTGKLAYVLSLHDCNLVDHVIVSDTDSYSYYYDNKLDKVLFKYKDLM